MYPFSKEEFPFMMSFTPCECCNPRYTTCTATTHKWTEKEIKEEILAIVEQLIEAKWYNKYHIRSNLKHWSKKLKKLQEVKEEFDLFSN